jgi:hypothetical protein
MLFDRIIDAVIDQNPELEVLTALEVLAHHFGRLEKPTKPARYPLHALLWRKWLADCNSR